jgi:hypothetical protein
VCFGQCSSFGHNFRGFAGRRIGIVHEYGGGGILGAAAFPVFADQYFKELAHGIKPTQFHEAPGVFKQLFVDGYLNPRFHIYPISSLSGV